MNKSIFNYFNGRRLILDHLDWVSEKKRSYRRHHKERMKAKARRVARIINGAIWNMSLGQKTYEERKRESEKFFEMNADNLCVCSCHMCRNPRHSRWSSGEFKYTIQERLAKMDHEEQLEELIEYMDWDDE